MRELGEMEKNPPEGIRIQSNDEDMLDFVGLVEGPRECLKLLSNRRNVINKFFQKGRLTPVATLRSSSRLMTSSLLRLQNVRVSPRF